MPIGSCGLSSGLVVVVVAAVLEALGCRCSGLYRISKSRSFVLRIFLSLC